MLGFRYLKTTPTTHVMQYKNGKLVRQGAGLSFFYFMPSSVVVQIPLASVGIPFVFNETTSDFQEATIQGDITYRVVDPEKLAAMLDHSVDYRGRYGSDDPSKLSERIIHAAQISAREFTQRNPLGELLTKSDELVATCESALKEAPAVAMLGVEIIGMSILSIGATPEMTKALQAEAREKLLQQADEAVHIRRNKAIELEREIKENELQTEIKVEEKKREVREMQLRADIAVEQQRTELVDQRVQNERKEAEARADGLRAILEPMKDVDWKTLLAASPGGINSQEMIAMAFRDLADNADKIGTLNMSPDLLNTLLQSNENEPEPPKPRPRRNRE
ncbi:SPFH domain-containing protein [Mariniblastus fucicola]|uniref:SPFH domain / Band 7 family protein n=1 Tax=Mariniblastus fucicola TaxID=980251 RepID=A0A5B9PE17_9BACT|nr:SPFH domain-containing protein [Mariniblastus fucicola]QEG24534.1 SPFH domain / Band 7 family protein [Mariniblastus fucicola]